MEYKFDQLKVETFEGTLNIGLNPSDLQGIEDFSVPSKNGTNALPKERMAMFTELKVPYNEYLDTNLQSIMVDAGQQLKFQVDETYHDFILQDIKRQLPNRIEYYLNQPVKNGQYEQNNKKNGLLNN